MLTDAMIEADQNGDDEQDVKILAAIQLLDDDAGDGKNVLMAWVAVGSR
jgi:hypothetical protein